MEKRVLSTLMALILCLSLLPAATFAAEGNAEEAGPPPEQGNEITNTGLVLSSDTDYTQAKTYSAGNGIITVAASEDNKTLNVTLDNAAIEVVADSKRDTCAIEIRDIVQERVAIQLVGTNELRVLENGEVEVNAVNTGIRSTGTAPISISGPGSLKIYVQKTTCSYGINVCSHLEITGGSLEITGSNLAAGICATGASVMVGGDTEITLSRVRSGIRLDQELSGDYSITLKDEASVSAVDLTFNGNASIIEANAGDVFIQGNARCYVSGDTATSYGIRANTISISDHAQVEVSCAIGFRTTATAGTGISITGGTVVVNAIGTGFETEFSGSAGIFISGTAKVSILSDEGCGICFRTDEQTFSVTEPAVVNAVLLERTKGLYTVYGDAVLADTLPIGYTEIPGTSNWMASKLSVPAGTTLIIPKGAAVDATSATEENSNPLSAALSVEGSVVVNGTLQLPAGTTAEEIQRLNLSGSGTVTVAGETATSYHIVTFDSQGGTAVESQIKGDEELVIRPAAPTRTDCTFLGWYTDAGCTTQYAFDAPVTSSLTLYAGWLCPVTFHSQEGTEVEGQTVASGQTVKKPADPTRSGYTFGGWYTDPDCTTPYSFGTPVEGPLTLYAKWTVRSSGGSSSSSTTTEKNPDGSTTTTTTNKATGTVTETTKYPDGSATTVETKGDGTVTTTEKTADGTTTQTVETPDGSTSTTIKEANGTTATQVTDSQGRTETQVSLSAQAVEEARETGEPVALPVPPVPPAQETEAAPVVEIALPQGEEGVSVVIPVQDPTPGTVAVLLRADGTEEVVKDSLVTQEGVLLTLEEGASVKLLDNAMAFGDTQDHWAEDAIAFTSARELFAGTGPETFSPESPMTRAMLLTVLARLEGVDTTGGETWYQQAVDWAVSAGISDGSSPNASITREQMVTMLWRLVGSPTPEGSLTGFADGASVSDYARAGVTWAVDQGILFGTTRTTLSPQGNATRAEVATILMRFLNQK